MKISLNVKVLSFFFFSTLIVVSSVFYIFFTNFNEELIKNSSEKLTLIRDTKKDELKNFFQEKTYDIELLAQSLSVVSLMNALEHEVDADDTAVHTAIPKEKIAKKTLSYLPAIVKTTGLSALHIMTANHPDIVYSTMQDNLPSVHPYDEAWKTDVLLELYSDVTRSDKTTYSDLTLYSKENKLAFFLATPIKNKETETVGLLIFQFPVDVINNIINVNNKLLTESEEFYLVGSDHLMRSNSRLDSLNRTVTQSFLNPEKGRVQTRATKNALQGESGTKFITDYRNVTVLSAYTYINLSKNVRWALIAEVDKDNILKSAIDVRNKSFATTFYSLLVILLLLFILLRRSLLEPLEKFKEVIVNITKSKDLNQTIEGGLSTEIDAISDSFNILLFSLNQAKNELEKSHNIIEKGQLIADIGVFEIDVVNNQVYFGSGIHKILQTDPKTFKASVEGYLSFIHPDDQQSFQKVYLDALHNATEGKFEHKLIRKDGSLAYVEISYSNRLNEEGEVIHLNGLVLDHTKPKELELKLQKLNNELEDKVDEKTQELAGSLKEFEHLFNTTIEGIIISQNGICIDTNDEAVTIFGFNNKSEMVGQSLINFVSEDFKETVIEGMKKNGVVMYEAELLHKDGSTFPALLKGHEFTNYKGTFRIFATMDISEIKEKEQQLLLQSRHAQMGEMIAMIAHQWRQPLASISATIGSLQMKQALEKYNKEFYDEQFQNIANFTQHLSRTIEDFRDFFKEEKKETSIKLEKIIESSLTIIKPLLESNKITISTDYQSNEYILSYPNELKQVLLNILKNAQEVLEERDINNPHITLSTYKDEDYLYFEVKDNAGGVSDDIIDKIFNPYFTTKGKLHGTGLGLYMSQKIISEHCHGNLEVTNSDHGAIFIGKLPRTIQDVT